HEASTRFRMAPEFVPAAGAEGWQLSNPPVLAMAPLRASLEQFERAGGMAALRAKSERLTGLLERLIHERLADTLQVVTPADPRLPAVAARDRRPRARPGIVRAPARARLPRRLARAGRDPHRPGTAVQPLRRSAGAGRGSGTLAFRLTARPRPPTPRAASAPPTPRADAQESPRLDSNDPRSLTLIGAGLAGCLLAILLSQRGWKVTIYERRG